MLCPAAPTPQNTPLTPLRLPLPTGRFGFVEMRTEELSHQAMLLDKVELCGRSINVGRPKGYVRSHLSYLTCINFGLPPPLVACLTVNTPDCCPASLEKDNGRAAALREGQIECAHVCEPTTTYMWKPAGLKVPMTVSI